MKYLFTAISLILSITTAQASSLPEVLPLAPNGGSLAHALSLRLQRENQLLYGHFILALYWKTAFSGIEESYTEPTPVIETTEGEHHYFVGKGFEIDKNKIDHTLQVRATFHDQEFNLIFSCNLEFSICRKRH